MAKSRYSDADIVEDKYYESFDLRTQARGLKRVDILEGITCVDYVVTVGDRLDHLAAKFMGDDEYWWLIALVNDIDYPFYSGGLTVGRTLKIPMNAKDVLDRIMR